MSDERDDGPVVDDLQPQHEDQQDEAPEREEIPESEPFIVEPAAEATVEATGHAEVDEILTDLERLDSLEVHDHVAEFESAHQALRRALDAGGS